MKASTAWRVRTQAQRVLLNAAQRAARIIESEQDVRNDLPARQALQEGFDYVPEPFRTIEWRCRFSPRTESNLPQQKKGIRD